MGMRSAATGVLFLLLTAISVVTASPAGACSCAAATDDEALEMADVVFVGELVAHDAPDAWQSSKELALRTFEVDRVFKGEATEVQIVASPVSGASCGLEIQGPGTFLVFAMEQAWPGDPAAEEGAVHASLCGGTRAVGAPPPATFRDGGLPVSVEMAAQETSPSATTTEAGGDGRLSPWTASAGVAILVGFVGAVVVARRAHRSG